MIGYTRLEMYATWRWESKRLGKPENYMSGGRHKIYPVYVQEKELQRKNKDYTIDDTDFIINEIKKVKDISMLPKYLTSNNKVIREAAKKRFQKLGGK